MINLPAAIQGILSVAVVFGLAVFVHEFGHFIFARIRGVGVEAFAIGFGPKIFAWKRGGTEYSIRWLPLGGFVRLHQMVREDALEEEAGVKATEAEAKAAPESKEAKSKGAESVAHLVHEDMEALYDKGLLTKLLVFGGGVFFNYLTAIAGVALLYVVGFNQFASPDPWVGEVKNPALADAGLASDDHFVEVEGKPVKSEKEFAEAFRRALKSGDGADGLDVKVRRVEGGQEKIVALKLPPLTTEGGPPYFEEKEGALAGWVWELKPYVGGVIPYRPAAKAGIQEGDLIVKVNGEPVSRWSEVTKEIRRHPEDAVSLEMRRKGAPADIRLSLVPEENPNEPGTGLIGIVVGTPEQERVHMPFLQAVAHAPKEANERLAAIAVGTFMTLSKAVTQRNVKALKRDMGGPLAIFNLTYTRARKGFADLLDWFIMLNLILAVMNLLPIPILDGGFIALSVIEGVVRRPVPVKILGPIYTFFFFCFITLFVLISYGDIVNIFFRP